MAKKKQKGHNLTRGESFEDDDSSKNALSTSILHPQTSIANVLLYLVILSLSLLQAYLAWGTNTILFQNIEEFLFLLIGIPILILIPLLHDFQRGIFLTRTAVLTIVSIDNPFATFDNSEKEEAYDGQILDNASRSMANCFRFWGFSLVPITLLLVASLGLRSNVPAQSYGLVLDAVGGIFLALEVLRTDQLGRFGVDLGSSNAADESRIVTDGIWGAMFLVFGFLLQFVSFLPGSYLFSTLPNLC